MNRGFGRDTGDVYGRHALRNPGGDSVQRDVLHVLTYPLARWIHPTRVRADYVGSHRVTGHHAERLVSELTQ